MEAIANQPRTDAPRGSHPAPRRGRAASQRTWASLQRAAAALAIATLFMSCNNYPVHSLLENFSVRVTDKLNTSDAVKLDFLWVIDHSSSMCQEQRDLAKGFQQFVTKLQSLGSIDAQMAVVTVQQTPDKEEVRVVGRFKREPATGFPPNCIERVRMPCTSDAQCQGKHSFPFATTVDSSLCTPNPQAIENKYTTGMWRCKKPPEASAIANINCSINSTCESACKDIKNHTDCRATFEPDVPKDKQRIRCHVPGGGTNLDSAGCMFPPDTETCPKAADLPAVLNTKQLDLFRCIATVGASQKVEAGFEGGFRSAWQALDPAGPNCSRDACVKHLRSCCVDDGAFCSPTYLNDPKVSDADKKENCWCYADKNAAKCAAETTELCEPLKDSKNCQFKRLVRDDAYLVIVFVSDDDDCSMPLNLNPLDRNVTNKENWQVCQKAGDVLGANVPLNEGNCEFRRGKNANLFCPSDCLAGSTTKDVTGKLKCLNGCKDGSAEQAACSKLADAEYLLSVKKTPLMAPVNEFVNRFKSLKPDPARVIVATIVGDTNVGNSSELTTHRDRVNFYHSLFRDISTGKVPYVCQGSRGESGYGSRYIELAESFRENGVVQNICNGADFGPALESIATTILRRVIKLCLPQPPFVVDGERKLTVTRTRGGKTEKLTLTDGPVPGDSASYYIVASPDCRAGKTDLPGQLAACNVTRDCNGGLTCIDNLCQIYNEAIFFSDVPEPNDSIEINYGADLGL